MRTCGHKHPPPAATHVAKSEQIIMRSYYTAAYLQYRYFAAVTLTFKGGDLWVAVAETSGEMCEDPLSFLRFSHQWKSL